MRLFAADDVVGAEGGDFVGGEAEFGEQLGGVAAEGGCGAAGDGRGFGHGDDGTNDALREADATELGDGLPCSVEKWVERCGYRRFKLKVKGADPVAEAQWVAGVYEEVAAIRTEWGRGGEAGYLVDPNEGCLGPWVVLEFLDGFFL